MAKDTNEEISKKLSTVIKKLDVEELRLEKILNKIEDISKKIDLSSVVSENESMIITSKIEEIKTTLRISYEHLTKKFEIETEKDGASSN